jgi:Flagellar filament outer layer protein Flaa
MIWIHITINGKVIENKTCIGIKLSFNRQGYSHVDLCPLDFKDGKYVKTTLPFTGIVKQIDLWVWGANYNYTMEMVLRDYNGVEYRLPVGSIQHVDWKHFTIEIPDSIPQTGSRVLSQYEFSLEKLVIWTAPEKKVNGAYVYISYIKYLADIFNNYYDGNALENQDNVDKLWEKAPKGPNKDIK